MSNRHNKIGVEKSLDEVSDTKGGKTQIGGHESISRKEDKILYWV